jgi:hypothetical protein
MTIFKPQITVNAFYLHLFKLNLQAELSNDSLLGNQHEKPADPFYYCKARALNQQFIFVVFKP